jgi:hypothetical protein
MPGVLDEEFDPLLAGRELAEYPEMDLSRVGELTGIAE